MKKAVLLVALATFAISAAPSFAQTSAASGGDGKVKTAAKKVGAGIMWGPKKIGQGLKKMGAGAKKMVGK
jgi:hypothetical protein